MHPSPYRLVYIKQQGFSQSCRVLVKRPPHVGEVKSANSAHGTDGLARILNVSRLTSVSATDSKLFAKSSLVTERVFPLCIPLNAQVKPYGSGNHIIDSEIPRSDFFQEAVLHNPNEMTNLSTSTDGNTESQSNTRIDMMQLGNRRTCHATKDITCYTVASCIAKQGYMREMLNHCVSCFVGQLSSHAVHFFALRLMSWPTREKNNRPRAFDSYLNSTDSIFDSYINSTDAIFDTS